MAARRGASVRGKPLPRGGRPRSRQAAGRDTSVVVHPDGWYWIAPDGVQQFGPFETAALARNDRDRLSVEGVNPQETEREAECSLGVADAVDEERGDREAMPKD